MADCQEEVAQAFQKHNIHRVGYNDFFLKSESQRA